MKKMLKLVAIAAIGMFVLAGCRTSAVYNVNNAPLMEKKLTEKDVFKAIYGAGTTLGWDIKRVKPGLAIAELKLRKHVARVEVTYDTNTFSIKYKNSVNLNYDSVKGTIHKNYNGWIQNLEKAIHTHLKLVKM